MVTAWASVESAVCARKLQWTPLPRVCAPHARPPRPAHHGAVRLPPLRNVRHERHLAQQDCTVPVRIPNVLLPFEPRESRTHRRASSQTPGAQTVGPPLTQLRWLTGTRRTLSTCTTARTEWGRAASRWKTTASHSSQSRSRCGQQLPVAVLLRPPLPARQPPCPATK